MDPNKRGNPPFAPSSYAAGLERRVTRLTAWVNDAREAARMLFDGNEADKAFARAWWRKQLDPPQVVASGMSASGQDPAEGLEAKPASATGAAGDAK